MRKLVTILDISLPFYFLFMLIQLTQGYVPSIFQIYLMVILLFLALIYTQRLIRQNRKLREWQLDAVAVMDELLEKNSKLRAEIVMCEIKNIKEKNRK